MQKPQCSCESTAACSLHRSDSQVFDIVRPASRPVQTSVLLSPFDRSRQSVVNNLTVCALVSIYTAASIPTMQNVSLPKNLEAPQPPAESIATGCRSTVPSLTKQASTSPVP